MKQEVLKALYTKLNATSGVTSLLSSATAIYIRQAPAPVQGGTPREPFIVLSLAAGGDDNDSPTESGDLRISILATALDTLTYGGSKRADDIAEAVRTALHEKQAGMSIDSPWNIYRIQHLTPIELVENISSVQYYRSGGVYRVRISV